MNPALRQQLLMPVGGRWWCRHYMATRLLKATFSSSPPPSASSLQSLADRMLQLKSQLPPHLLMRLLSAQHKISSSTANITVVADHHPDQVAVLDCLLGSSAVPAHAHPLTLETPDSADALITQPALHKSKWTLIQSTELLRPELLNTSPDLVLLITNPYHQLCHIKPHIANLNYPTLLVLNGIEHLNSIKNDLGPILVDLHHNPDRVFPVSTRRYAVHKYLDAHGQDDGGIPHLAQYLTSILACPKTVNLLHMHSLAVTLDEIATHVITAMNDSVGILDSVDRRFNLRVKGRLLDEQERLLTEFRGSGRVGNIMSTAEGSTRTFLNNISIWQLFASGVTQDQSTHLWKLSYQALEEAKHWMALCSGKSAESHRYLLLDLTREINLLYKVVHKHPVELQTNAVLAPVLVLLDRIHLLLNQQKSSELLDPFALSNIVSRYQDLIPPLIGPLQVDSDHLRLHTWLSVGLSWVAIGILSCAGVLVNPVVAILSGSLISAGFLWKLKRGWSAFVNRYIRALTCAELELQKELTDHYHQQVYQKLTVPLSNIVDQYEVSSNQQHAYVTDQISIYSDMKTQLQPVCDQPLALPGTSQTPAP